MTTKRCILLFLALACFVAAGVAGCAGMDSGSVKIVFVQDGRSDVVMYVEKGGTLYNVPLPVSEEGYEIEWDETDFSCLTENKTVTAVKTPLLYLITYNLGSRSLDDFARIEATEQYVYYNSVVTTYKPVCAGYLFVGWQVQGKGETFTDGKYAYAENITLVAEWAVNEDDDERYSPIVPSKPI